MEDVGGVACRIRISVFVALALQLWTGCQGSDSLEPRNGLAFLLLNSSVYSGHKEELITRLFFDDKRDGCFIDIGAGHYQYDSTTYYIEKQLGWAGFAFDRDARLGPEYSSYRPQTLFYNVDISDSLNTPHIFWDGVQPIVSHTIQLDALYYQLLTPEHLDRLAKARCNHADFVSISVDGFECKVLSKATTTLQRLRPRLVRISRTNQQTADIGDEAEFLSRLGYRLLDGIYPALDPRNIYFAAKDEPKLSQAEWSRKSL